MPTQTQRHGAKVHGVDTQSASGYKTDLTESIHTLQMILHCHNPPLHDRSHAHHGPNP